MSEELILEICKRLDQGTSTIHIANEYGIPHPVVCLIESNRGWRPSRNTPPYKLISKD